MFFETYSLEEEIDGTPMDLMALYVTGNYLADKCRKVITSFNLTIYDIP